MDFKDFINQIKELSDPAVFAIIAKLAIAFYFLKFLYKGLKTFLIFIFKSKDEFNKYSQLQKDSEENKKRDEKTHKLIEEFKEKFEERISKLEVDLNAYRDVKHDKDKETVEARQTMKLVLEKLTLINK